MAIALVTVIVMAAILPAEEPQRITWKTFHLRATDGDRGDDLLHDTVAMGWYSPKKRAEGGSRGHDLDGHGAMGWAYQSVGVQPNPNDYVEESKRYAWSGDVEVKFRPPKGDNAGRMHGAWIYAVAFACGGYPMECTTSTSEEPLCLRWSEDPNPDYDCKPDKKYPPTIGQESIDIVIEQIELPDPPAWLEIVKLETH